MKNSQIKIREVVKMKKTNTVFAIKVNGETTELFSERTEAKERYLTLKRHLDNVELVKTITTVEELTYNDNGLWL